MVRRHLGPIALIGQARDRRGEPMAVIGASPVTFISEDMATGNHGTQYQVPLSLLSFDKTGTTIDPKTGWSEFTKLATSDQTLLENPLKNLVSQGLLTKPPS